MRWLRYIMLCGLLSIAVGAAAQEPVKPKEQVNVKELILDHIADAYSWHITSWRGEAVAIPLPVIVYGRDGWSLFSSKRIAEGKEYRGYHVAPDGDYKGKLVENIDGVQVRPFDISISKNVFALFINSALLLFIILYLARWYPKQKRMAVPGGFRGAVEMLVMNIQDDLVKKCIGKGYERYSPYLLTVFFFVLINNVMGLLPIFPGGANTTGNIAVTFVLAMCTFFIVNIFGTREYWKEILWPDVPLWLKLPIPLMPIMEIFGIFTKPFALMIRLFANIMAGHSIILGLTCIVFVTYLMGPTINTGMTIFSVILSFFMSFVELLVAFIQAYVFTMLSAVFIGLSQIHPHQAKKIKQ